MGQALGFGLSFLHRRGPYGPTGCLSGEARRRHTTGTQQPLGCWAGHTPRADVSVLGCASVQECSGSYVRGVVVVWLFGSTLLFPGNFGETKPPESEQGKSVATLHRNLSCRGSVWTTESPRMARVFRGVGTRRCKACTRGGGKNQ